MSKVQENQTPYSTRASFLEKAADSFMRLVEGLAESKQVTQFADGFVEAVDKKAAQLEPIADGYVKLVEGAADNFKTLEEVPGKIEKLVEKWL